MSSAAMSYSNPNVVKKVELDALFDYSKVAPIIVLEDSDEEDVQIIDKIEVKTRRRSSIKPLQVVQANIEKPVVTQVVKKVDNDDDWLAPPTRTGVRGTQPADLQLHILKLQRQKAELLNLSVDSVRMAAESAELEAKASLASSNLPAAVPNAVAIERQNSRAKIMLQLQEQGGKTHSVKIYMDDKFEKLFTIFAEKIAKRPVKDFTFRFDGTALHPHKTPKDLELEDEDMIEVDVKSTQSKRFDSLANL